MEVSTDAELLQKWQHILREHPNGLITINFSIETKNAVLGLEKAKLPKQSLDNVLFNPSIQHISKAAAATISHDFK